MFFVVGCQAGSTRQLLVSIEYMSLITILTSMTPWSSWSSWSSFSALPFQDWMIHPQNPIKGMALVAVPAWNWAVEAPRERSNQSLESHPSYNGELLFSGEWVAGCHPPGPWYPQGTWNFSTETALKLGWVSCLSWEVGDRIMITTGGWFLDPVRFHTCRCWPYSNPWFLDTTSAAPEESIANNSMQLKICFI